MIRLLLCLGVALALCVSPATAQDNEFVSTSGNFEFKLRNGLEFSGFMTDKSTIDLLVAGQEVKVPVPLVESIQFGEDDATRLQMQLNNGDSLSGQIMPSKLDVVAEWGTLKVNSAALAQMTRANPPTPPETETVRPRRPRRPASRTTNSTAVVPASPTRTGGN